MSPSSPSRSKEAPWSHMPQERNENNPAAAPTSSAASPPLAKPPLTTAIAPDAMRFADLAAQHLLSPILVQTITEELGFDRMTPVQQATLPYLLRHREDCLGQAKTGTGKTIAFLLPAIQALINNHRQGSHLISLLVISPTRELAMQIAKEAQGLLGRLPQYKVCIAIGGTNKDREQRDILSGCDILIATPGRLYDHLSDPRIVALFEQLDTLVLDEADRLLDMGFMNALKDIIACLPDKEATKRHGMLFSATVSPHVNQFAHLALAPEYKFISTIPEGELNTHEHVEQLLITVPNFSDVLPAALAAIRREIAEASLATFKAILFTPTAAHADWYALTLAQAYKLPPVSTLHARMSQNKRTSVTNEFREAASALLIATDVVARGMDFPNVSTVIQTGIPADKESYIHRLGRTARAGRKGRGIFIITEAESFFPKYRLKDITFTPTPAEIFPDDIMVVEEAAAEAANSEGERGKLYQAWLGYYKSHLKALGWTNEQLVEEANRYATDALCIIDVPQITKTTVDKMGLKGVKGLNVVPRLSISNGFPTAVLNKRSRDKSGRRGAPRAFARPIRSEHGDGPGGQRGVATDRDGL